MKQAAKAWEIRRFTRLTGEYYTVSRAAGRRREHFEYASDGQPMLYGPKQAREAVDRATKAEAGK